MINEDRFEAYMKCINIVQEEEELEGEPSHELLMRIKSNPIPYFRNAIRVTKDRIVKKITDEINGEST